MKETPMLFSAPMVRAIDENRKTQTRRTARAQTQNQADIIAGAIMDDMNGADDGTHEKAAWERIGCPYGNPGDRLWVREEHYQCGHWKPVEGVKTKQGQQKWKFVPTASTVLFPDDLTADFEYRKARHRQDPDTIAWHKRLARFMPRKYSRTTLEVVSVRVERLQEISEADAAAEGAAPYPFMDRMFNPTTRKMDIDGNFHRPRFKTLWKQINGPGSWAANPWVWVVEFRKIENNN